MKWKLIAFWRLSMRLTPFCKCVLPFAQTGALAQNERPKEVSFFLFTFFPSLSFSVSFSIFSFPKLSIRSL